MLFKGLYSLYLYTTNFLSLPLPSLYPFLPLSLQQTQQLILIASRHYIIFQKKDANSDRIKHLKNCLINVPNPITERGSYTSTNISYSITVFLKVTQTFSFCFLESNF